MKILIIDDHPIFCNGLMALLSQMETTPEVIAATTEEEAYQQAQTHDDFDIVLLDLFLPEVSGLSVLAQFRQNWPQLPVIILSSSEDLGDARASLKGGAMGYVPKSAQCETLFLAIKLVMAGHQYLSPLLLTADGASPAPALPAPGIAGRPPALTRRQMEVLKHLALDQTNKVIADELALAEKTVKTHITAIFSALGVNNRTQAVETGRELGLI